MLESGTALVFGGEAVTIEWAWDTMLGHGEVLGAVLGLEQVYRKGAYSVRHALATLDLQTEMLRGS